MIRHEGERMAEEHECSVCSATGCTGRKTDESTAQEISAGAYLIVAAMAIVLVSLAIKWLL
jgi:hypothetical protein